MNAARIDQLAAAYANLRVAVVGDVCLDRYLEIDPSRGEVSIETGLPVHNVARVRAQPGAAGTVLNNLSALGAGRIDVIGFCGDDGEGYELRRALGAVRGVSLDRFITTAERRTFTYCKPLIVESGKAPKELSRLDTKNWTPTPESLQAQLARHVLEIAESVDAIVVMDQVDAAETGVVTRRVQQAAREAQTRNQKLWVIADSRRGLGDYPALSFKMNEHELCAMAGIARHPSVEDVRKHAAALARRNGQAVFVSMAERGIVGALASGETEHVPSLPLRGEIDVVGAGDSVTASVALALAAGASLKEAMMLAMGAASLVIHQLGTTGTATMGEIRDLIGVGGPPQRGG